MTTPTKSLRELLEEPARPAYAAPKYPEAKKSGETIGEVVDRRIMNSLNAGKESSAKLQDQFNNHNPLIPLNLWPNILWFDQRTVLSEKLREGYVIDEGRCYMHSAVVIRKGDHCWMFRFNGITSDFPVAPIKTDHYLPKD